MPAPRFLSTGLAAVAILLLRTAALGQDSPTVPKGFTIERIAAIPHARELAVTPSGDLLVGTARAAVMIVPGAEGKPGVPAQFAAIDDPPVAGVALGGDELYVGGQFAVYRLRYRAGDRRASARPQKIASLRTSGDARGHSTTSVAVSGGKVYASVGSSCNACDPELDKTRATIQEMDADGKAMRPRAVDIRNAIALAVQPPGGDVWAGVAGRDDLEQGHPYEIFDDVSSHAGTPDYGWLTCYDDRKPIGRAACGDVVVPKVVFPAYATPIGAVFYPTGAHGKYAFPGAYRGGAFVTLHGSWHTPLVAPRVAFVPFKDGRPARAVDWSNPEAQSSTFLGGCQSGSERSCRPTGIAVGNDGSLFVAEDEAGAIYRIRPAGR